jgi:hypothetical protein
MVKSSGWFDVVAVGITAFVLVSGAPVPYNGRISASYTALTTVGWLSK